MSCSAETVIGGFADYRNLVGSATGDTLTRVSGLLQNACERFATAEGTHAH